ncbi:ligand-binding sensor domain-containing protein [Flavihumibacter petaseus]|uniref:Putative two-component histidine kinase n=1 Tax=Flavihumibacter petaseus NBRC 106054 TaxID=1220578 RepID=A0A0E9N6H0_9BACT|nr:two-component regulator propeller domain-containing protein [Flavihumibacter petaseus]GAO45542.1 putative two-component histidine kinase [Flavihumibacter petaseus NBRC 106054]
MPFRRIALLLAVILPVLYLNGQTRDIKVHVLTAANGLADGVIRAIGQDKYGYMWIGTISGLNRYDGTTVKKYYNIPNKPHSLPASVPRAIFCDRQGTLWIGFNDGLYQFDHHTEQFILVNGTKGVEFRKIREDLVTGDLLFLTNKGLLRITRHKMQAQWLVPAWVATIHDFDLRNGVLYAVCGAYSYVLNLHNGHFDRIADSLLPERNATRIAFDHDGRILVACYGKGVVIRRIDPSLKSSRELDISSKLRDTTTGNVVMSMLTDHKNRLWIATTSQWLFSYDNKTGQSRWYDDWDPFNKSVSLYVTSPLFQSNNDFIWVGTEGNGVGYFHPDRTPFSLYAPVDNEKYPIVSPWARAVMEEPNGNLWMGWASGISRFNPSTETYSNWRNSFNSTILYSSSIRSIAWDNDTLIWIGTSRGMNRYNPVTDKMLYNDPHNRLPLSFYWCVKKDTRGNVWFGTGNSLYYQAASDRNIHIYSEIPELINVIDTGVRVIYEDKQKRLWMGMDGTGLRMYDPVRHTVKQWQAGLLADGDLLGNTITAITEDHAGVIWLSSFNGLVGYDPKSGKFQKFTVSQGLPAAKCSGLLVDDADRLWVATTAGLAMLDNVRKHFTLYTTEDGLPTLEFSDMPALRKRNGDFVFPTMNGFVEFKPLEVKPQSSESNLHLASIKIFDKPYIGKTNIEDLREIRLKSNENFISFQMVDLNNNIPNQRFFAYKLEDVDRDWVINTTGMASYTKLPGGNYTFRYKTSNDAEQWILAPEKSLRVHIETVYYKSTWFWLMITFVVVSFSYLWYRNRLQQQKKIYLLQSRAQLLEKEKAMAMFEALKQQLNPHFLFNSLSSLGSLIRTDQHLAGKFLESLSKTYRYILQSRNNDLIPLEEEIKFVSSYIRLLETRFQSALITALDIESGKLNRKIVPVTLQNLIDNAIKHNSIDQDMPLIIRIFTEGQYLVVRNNIQKKSNVETSNQQGLQQMKSLYTYFTQQPILVEETDDSFQVKIPLI